MSITQETVLKIAWVAKIGICEAEAERFASEMSKVDAFVDKLAGLPDPDLGAGVGAGSSAGSAALSADVASVGRAASPSGALRDDVCVISLPREELLANAPERDESCFIVPKVMDQ